MARLHVPPVVDGRHLTASERAELLKAPGETWATWDELFNLRASGKAQDLRAVELIWHGEYGSIRRSMTAHLEA